MRKTPILILGILTLTFLAACAKDEAPATTTAPQLAAVDREAEVLAPPEPTETVTAESTGDAFATSEAAPGEPVVASPQQQARANTPPPLLPRLGQSAPASTAATPAHRSRIIMVPEAWEILQAGDGVLLDVRNEDAYQYQRIPGAVNIPLNQVASRANELPQDKWIITYCTCPAEETSGAAANTLANMGFERVAALVGGMQAWRGARLPVEFGQ